MGGALAFAFTAALNPTLLTATLVMLVTSEPRRLMSGFLLGAYTISIAIGLVIVFVLKSPSTVNTTQHTFSPAADVVFGLLLLLIAYVLHSDRAARAQERRKARAEAKGPKPPPRWRTTLDQGSARSAYVVGILLTLPGASYLVGMNRISKANVSNAEAALGVVLFCVIMLLLIEIPLLWLIFRPEQAKQQLERFTDWLSGNTRMIVTRIALVMGLLLLLRAVITVLS